MGVTSRAAIIGGRRTPFVKAGSTFKDLSMQELGAHVLKSVVEHYDVNPESIDEFVFSTVLLDPRTPNWAREILFAAGLPRTVYAQSISNNCISGLIAITSSAERIQLGRVNCAIAGGSESMSNPSLVYNKRISKAFLEASRARSLGERLKHLSRIKLKDFMPAPPAVTEPSTGLTMGQHMEITAKEMHIARQAQDELTYRSHKNAAAATADGRLTLEIEPLAGAAKDLIIRGDTTVEKLAKLRPVFDRGPEATLTAGNSSALTDGASAVLLMSEQRAKEEDREVLTYIRDYEYSAISANDGLLMAPAVAVPRMLKRNGLKLEDFDLIEIHEAFAAQVLANVQAWENGWKEDAVGKIDWNKVNVMGGSLAIGHPFAATGGRIVTSLAHEMKRRKAKRGLISICAAGAMAGAMILES